MNAQLWSWTFIAALLIGLSLRAFLAMRQVRHILDHDSAVPAGFEGQLTLKQHQKAADYAIDQLKFGFLEMILSALLLVGWTLYGGLQALQDLANALWPLPAGLAHGLTMVLAFLLISTVIDWPMSYWRQFRLEARHGFNRMTPRVFWQDELKGLGISLALMGPLCALLLYLVDAIGPGWWWAAWAASAAYVLFATWIAPTWISPLFNRFEPLKDEALRARVQALLDRTGFQAEGIYVMDGSKRSTHANAYFTGLGRKRRVVFYDTLLEQLQPDEIEAILAHELGHNHHRHLPQMMLSLLAGLGIAFALMGHLHQQAWFFEGLGLTPMLLGSHAAGTLLLFMLVSPVFMFFVTPLMAWRSRVREFQADAYACQHASGDALARALVKTSVHNASTLTSDPWYVRAYYSHPPIAQRLAAIRGLASPSNQA